MLFHITARHRPENCPSNNPEVKAALARFEETWSRADADAPAKVGVRLAAGPAHTLFFVVEAADLEAVQAAFRGFPGYHDFEVTPVTPLATVLR